MILVQGPVCRRVVGDGEVVGNQGVQGRVVLLEGQHVVAAPRPDAAGDGSLAAHRVDRDDRAVEVEDLQQRRDRDDLVMRLPCWDGAGWTVNGPAGILDQTQMGNQEADDTEA